MPHAHRTFAARRRAATDAHNCGSRRPPLRDYVVEDVGGPGPGSRVDGRRVSGTGHAVAVGGFDRRVEVNTARPSRHRAKDMMAELRSEHTVKNLAFGHSRDVRRSPRTAVAGK